VRGFLCIFIKPFALDLGLPYAGSSYFFASFALTYSFGMLTQKKSNQKTLVQKKVTEWCGFAAFE
jgi:hypothetical protein